MRSLNPVNWTSRLTISDNVHLVLLDFYIPGFDALYYIQQLRHTFLNIKIIVISSSVSPTDRKECLQAGAKAYFEKHLPPDIFLPQLKKVIKDEVIDNDLSFVDKKNEDYSLGIKKKEILILLARGYSNKKIATRLGVSPETVKTHLAETYKLIGVCSRDEARDWAGLHGLV